MSIEEREVWFRAKSYGWGWGLPVAWQGWLVLATYVCLAVLGAVWLVRPQQAVAYFVYMLLLTSVLTAVCWFKGERPTWRWGGK